MNATATTAASHEFGETSGPRQCDPSLLGGQRATVGRNRIAAVDVNRSSDKSRHERIKHIVGGLAPSPIVPGKGKPVRRPFGKITDEPGPNC